MNKTFKLVVIDKCDFCPHFDNEYWGWHKKCLLLDREITRNYSEDRFEIPPDCPLPSVGVTVEEKE